MALLPLANGGTTLVDDDLADFLGQRTWWRDSKGYAVRREGKRVILLHRVVLGTAAGLHTDHRNRDRLDNRLANLRSASPGANACNRVKPAGADSPHKGVRRWRRRFIARISYERRLIYLGSFPSAEMASAAYDIAALQLHGAFAHPNRVPGGPPPGSPAWRALEASVTARIEASRTRARTSTPASPGAAKAGQTSTTSNSGRRSPSGERFQPPLVDASAKESALPARRPGTARPSRRRPTPKRGRRERR
jgi:hypothetical protein